MGWRGILQGLGIKGPMRWMRMWGLRSAICNMRQKMSSRMRGTDSKGASKTWSHCRSRHASCESSTNPQIVQTRLNPCICLADPAWLTSQKQTERTHRKTIPPTTLTNNKALRTTAEQSISQSVSQSVNNLSSAFYLFFVIEIDIMLLRSFW